MAACAAAAVLWLAPRLAPADIEEQRSRLPPPATCPDPVEGIWMSHSYFPHVGAWYVFVLDVRRTGPGARTLVGETRVEYWHASPAEPAVPTKCVPGLVHRRISAIADGTLDGARFSWRGHTLTPEVVVCGGPLDNYELVTFNGDIDFAREEFQNILAAGPTWTDIRTVFRRIQCRVPDGTARPPPALPPPVVPPPPTLPPPRTSGCCAPF
jgi:hypothetical protein